MDLHKIDQYFDKGRSNSLLFSIGFANETGSELEAILKEGKHLWEALSKSYHSLRSSSVTSKLMNGMWVVLMETFVYYFALSSLASNGTSSTNSNISISVIEAIERAMKSVHGLKFERETTTAKTYELLSSDDDDNGDFVSEEVRMRRKKRRLEKKAKRREKRRKKNPYYVDSSDSEDEKDKNNSEKTDTTTGIASVSWRITDPENNSVTKCELKDVALFLTQHFTLSIVNKSIK